MKEIYMDAFSEVDAILNIMPSNLYNKIPLKFKQMISEYKNNSYNPRIEEPVEDYELKDETQIILSLIYRDFLCSDEEKERLKARDAQKLKEEDEQLREKYNPDNIFNNRKVENLETVTEPVAMMEYRESFFTRIINKIKNIFRRK
ncbi:MAG: hypothetical protein IKF38_06110 [Clostridia bacterium]|nr:hypothetical protein [Clostridia bacterium]